MMLDESGIGRKMSAVAGPVEAEPVAGLDRAALNSRAAELTAEERRAFYRQTAALVAYGEACEQGREQALVHLFPHVRADGDALGAAFAYGRLLFSLGFKPVIVTEEPVPEKMAYLKNDRVPVVVYDRTSGSLPPAVNFAIAVDCHGGDRLESRKNLFEEAACKMIIDHHPSQRPLFPLYLRSTGAAATCELVGQYFLFLAQADEQMFCPGAPIPERATSERAPSECPTSGHPAVSERATSGQLASCPPALSKLSDRLAAVRLDREAATALLTGLMTDTGRFSYSNTTARTLRTAALAREAGGDAPMLAVRHFDEITRARYELTGCMIRHTIYGVDGRLAVAWLSWEDMLQTGAVEDDTDGLSAQLRNIVGVEAAVLLREAESGEWHCSLRSGPAFDVSAFAGRYGGGGHQRAAGMTLYPEAGETGPDLAEQLLAELAAVLCGEEKMAPLLCGAERKDGQLETDLREEGVR